MPTKVVIAAAGQGTRMLNLTSEKSKHLIEVEKRPFLAYVLDNLTSAGYYDIVLVVGFKEELMQEFKKEYIKNYKGSQELKIQIVNQFEILGPKEKEYGTACPLKCVKDIVGQNSFIYLCGDNFYSTRDLESIKIQDEYNYVTGLVHENPERYGVLVTKNGFLEKIIEKPKEFTGNLINVSLYKFTPEIFEKVFQIQKSIRGEYEITDAINLLAQDNKVKVRELHDYWIDFGKPEDIEKVSEILKGNAVKV